MLFHIFAALRPTRRIARPLVALVLSGIAPPLFAQVTTTVRVPLSATKALVADACRGTVRPSGTASDSATDILVVNIRNDVDRPDTAAVPLFIRVGSRVDTLARGTSDRTLVAGHAGDFGGKVVTITRGEAVLVCAVSATPERQALSSSQAFRVGIGASFSFQSKLSTTHLYADAGAFIPDIAGSRFGIDAGIYTGRRSPRTDTAEITSPDAVRGTRRTTFYRDRPGADSVYRIVQLASLAKTTKEDNVGLWIAPTLRVSDNLHLVLQVDQTKRELSESVKVKVLSTDSSLVARADSIRPTNRPGLPGDTTETRPYTIFETMTGVGLLLDVRIGDVGLRLKPVLGVTRTDAGSAFGYSLQMRMTEFSKGLRIGADVRTFHSNRSPSLLVYLAKDTGLEKLADFLLGGEGEAK